MTNSKNIKTIYTKNRKEWRKWLLKNHKKENKVNLIKYRKHTGKPSVTSKQAMEEAICFGWIDTTMKRLDDERYMQRFSGFGTGLKPEHVMPNISTEKSGINSIISFLSYSPSKHFLIA